MEKIIKKSLKPLSGLLIIIYFILLELAWFHKGVTIQVLHIPFKAHNVQKLLLILVVLVLLWLLMIIPWRKSSFRVGLRKCISPWVFILPLIGVTLAVFFVKERTSLTHGLRGNYYLNPDWAGTPVFKRIDPEISFANHDLDEFSKENYSISWAGYIRIPRAGEYTFALRSDDGSTLFINGQLIIDNGGLHKAKTEFAKLRLDEGFHSVKVSYFQHNHVYLLHFYWARPKPFHWLEIVPSKYLYPEKPSPQAYQWEQGMENLALAMKILWLGVLLFYAQALYKNKAFRETYLIPFLLGGVLALAVLVRIYLLQYPLGTLDSDEAIEGLMAKHILTEGGRPILYYYLPYMGSLKAHMAALIFHFFGVSIVGLKSVSAFFFLVFTLLMFIFTREITDSKTALLTTLLIAISPGFLALRSIYAGAAYMEVLAFGTALLVVLTKILYPPDPEAQNHLGWYSLAGFLAGVGFWTNPLIVYYLITFIFFWFLKDKLFIFKKSFVVFVIFFSVGVFPLLIWNLEHQWGTYTFLTGGEEKNPLDSQLLQFPVNFHNLVTEAFPILVGTHTQYEKINIVGDLFYVVMGAYVLSLAYVLWRYDRSVSSLLRLSLPPSSFSWRQEGRTHQSRSFCNDSPESPFPVRGGERGKLEIPIVLTFVIVILFCSSRFGTVTLVPRYLLPLYSAFPIFLALLLLRIKKVSAVLFTLLLLSILGANFLGILYIHKNARLKEHRFQTFLSILQDRHIRYISTDYWIAYKITFASNEEIICSPNLGPTPEDKYPAYTQQVLSARERAYVAKIGHSKDKELKQSLSRHADLLYHNIKYYYSLYYPVVTHK